MIQTIHISSIKRHILMRMVPFLIPGVLLLSAYKAGTKKNNRAPFPSPGGLYDTNCYNTALTERHKTIKNDANASYNSLSNDIIQKAIHHHQKINHHQ